MIYEKKQIAKFVDKMKNLEIPYFELLFEEIQEIDVKKHNTDNHFRQVPQDVSWEVIHKGDAWGGPFKTMWLKGEVVIPKEYSNRKIVLCSEIDAFECFAFINDKPSGLFNKDGSIRGGNHSIVLVSKNAKAGEKHDIALECYAGTPCLGWAPYENYGINRNPDDEFIRKYNGVTLCAIREDVAAFVFDLRTLNQLLEISDEQSIKRGEVLATLMNVYKEIHQYPIDVNESVWRPAMHRAHEIMKVLLSTKGNISTGNVGLIGHAHMDTAWLWTVEETKRKCGRTFSNALTLMDWYPEYTFIQSSSLHSAWMKEYYPTIFEDMKKRIAEGRYEPNGAVWVECDCNITGSESMIRQFLWGQRFTMKEFGYKSDSFWLPDTFGYSAAIPQIMKGCDVKYFLTTKMLWNESNHFPYDSFTWKGQDGSAVLVHLNRMDTWPGVKEISDHYNTLSDKHVTDQKLISYGFGDGGGGPQYQMLEMAKRAENIEGCPKAKHTTVSEFMQQLEKSQDDLPVWVGELYLELHRGTLTSIHDIKKSNRKAEIALREYEMMVVYANAYTQTIIDRDKLNSWWEVLLRNQFHDILPGTCIPEVYDIAIPENYNVVNESNSDTKDILAKLGKDENTISFINTLNWNRSAQVSAEIDGYLENVISQDIIDVDGNSHKTFNIDIPAMGSVTYKKSDTKVKTEDTPFIYSKNNLDTPILKVIFSDDGSIESLIDKSSNRELHREGAAGLNTLYIAEDVPYSWDNWDIDPDISLKMRREMNLISSKVVADGCLQFRIENEYKIGENSSIKQHIIFYSDTKQIDFETKVDWKERHTLLKVGFDVDILSSTVKNEMQFGYVERPTHSNTSWDAAKTDLCNHKWSDLSEGKYGIALLNDCKYGMSCENSNMMLTLMKSGSHPDPSGDIGVHKFTYALLPHDGYFSTENVVQPAYELNIAPLMTESNITIEPLVQTSKSNIIIESIKPAEDNDGFIVRMYECEKALTQNVEVKFGKTPKAVYETNMLEDIKSEISTEDNVIKITFKPFEIKTILVMS
ncbi:MAG: alpha-mannosidase [Clostridiales bacterium]|nr:alpha-mannosidase [Clostridiales bacterium]